MASVGNLHSAMVMDTSRYAHGLKSSLMQTRSWTQDMKKLSSSLMTPMEKYRKELTRLNMMRAGVLDRKTGVTMRLGTEQHALAVANLRKQYSHLWPVVKKSQSAISKLGMSALRSLRPLMWFFGPLGILYGLRNMAKGAEDVNRSFQQSLAIMGDASEDLQGRMKSAARSVAFDTKWSAAEASSAYRFLAQAGYSAELSLAALPAVAAFAQAGMFDLSRATDLLTDAQIAMGLSSKDAQKNLLELTHVGDVLVKANTLANASVEQFSEALTTKAASTARLYGQSIEDTVAILAVFASAGVKGAAGGEQFSIVLRHMAINAVKNADAFEKLGIAVYDANTGAFRPARKIFEDMDRAMEHMSPRMKVLTLMQIGFTKKTIASTAVLLGMSDAMKKYYLDLLDAGGAMQDVSDKMMTDFAEGLNKIKAGIESLAVDTFTGAMQGLGNAVEAYADWSREAAEQQERLARAQKKTAEGGAGSIPRPTADDSWGMWGANRLSELTNGIANVSDAWAGIVDVMATGLEGGDVIGRATQNRDRVMKQAVLRWVGDNPAMVDYKNQQRAYNTAVAKDMQRAKRQLEALGEEQIEGVTPERQKDIDMERREILDRVRKNASEAAALWTSALSDKGLTPEQETKRQKAIEAEEMVAIAEAIENANKVSRDFLDIWSDKLATQGMTEKEKAMHGLLAAAEKFAALHEPALDSAKEELVGVLRKYEAFAGRGYAHSYEAQRLREKIEELRADIAVLSGEEFHASGKSGIDYYHDRQKAEKDAAKAQKDATRARERQEKSDASRIASLTKSVQSPIEAFGEGVEEAMHLRKMLGKKAFDRLINKYGETALSALAPGAKSTTLPAAHEVGTQGAYSATVQAAQGVKDAKVARMQRKAQHDVLKLIFLQLEEDARKAADEKPVEIMGGA